MSIETEPTGGGLIANEASASAKKKTAAAKPKGARVREPWPDDPALRRRRRTAACELGAAQPIRA